MGTRACRQCGGPMPADAHGNARVCSAECRRLRLNRQTSDSKTRRYHADPEYRAEVIARNSAYRKKRYADDPAYRERQKRSSALAHAARGERKAGRHEWTEEELNELIAEQSKRLPAWWNDAKGDRDGDD
jgi:hypothetical protein